MLDVHPPHHPTHTWKDFFIHIATIVVGLFIALGLEQSAVYMEHRHEVKETREALRVERGVNARRFAIQTREFHRFVPKLKTNLAILMYLKEHPHAPASQWPGRFDWLFYSSPYFDTAWTSAVQSNIVERLPDAERTDDAELAHRLAGLTANMEQRRSGDNEAQAMWIQTTDPSRMSPQQIDLAIGALTRALGFWYESARLQRGFRWPDVAVQPTREDMELILPPLSNDPESIAAVAAARHEDPSFESETQSENGTTSK